MLRISKMLESVFGIYYVFYFSFPVIWTSLVTSLCEFDFLFLGSDSTTANTFDICFKFVDLCLYLIEICFFRLDCFIQFIEIFLILFDLFLLIFLFLLLLVNFLFVKIQTLFVFLSVKMIHS